MQLPALRRKIRALPIAAFVLAVTALGVAPAASASTLADFDAARNFIPGEVLVKFKAGVTTQGRAALLDRLDATTKSNLPIPRLKLVRLNRGESVPEAVSALEDAPQVLYAEPNFIYRAEATPNDSLLGLLWGLNNTGQLVSGTSGTPDADIDAPLAWDKTTGSNSVTVAVADSGVAYDHPELAPNILPGHDFIDEDSDPRDFNGHGTHVAGTIGAAGNNGAGITGVSWDVALLPVRVLDGEGSGSNAAVAAGFAYAAAQGAEIVNASLSGPVESLAIREAIEDAPNTLFVVAAGNDAEDNEVEPRFPCNYGMANIICVAATDQNDELAGFSNFGAESVDLAAPGTNVLSTMAAYGSSLFTEGFESDIGATWTTGGTNNTWARTEESANGGSWSLADSPSGNYANSTNSFARNTSSFSLSGQTGCRLDYALNLESESGFDGLFIEATTNPAGTWTKLDSWSGSTSGFFFDFSNDLSAFDGEANVFIRFRFVSNSSVVEDGAHVDDVAVRCLTSSFTGNEFQFLDGTSMATPHVAGAAALLIAQHPGMSPTTVKSKLLASVDPLPSLAGLTVTGGRLNVGAVINPPPPPGKIFGPATPIPVATPVSKRCAAARRAVKKAKRKLARARKAAKQAQGKQQKKAAQLKLSQATKQLVKAKKRRKRDCRP